MEPVGINPGLFLVELITMVTIGLPLLSVIDLARKKPCCAPPATWVLLICAIPRLGSLACWLVKPTPETHA